jgi:hypothetical protein
VLFSYDLPFGLRDLGAFGAFNVILGQNMERRARRTATT